MIQRPHATVAKMFSIYVYMYWWRVSVFSIYVVFQFPMSLFRFIRCDLSLYFVSSLRNCGQQPQLQSNYELKRLMWKTRISFFMSIFYMINLWRIRSSIWGNFSLFFWIFSRLYKSSLNFQNFYLDLLNFDLLLLRTLLVKIIPFWVLNFSIHPIQNDIILDIKTNQRIQSESKSKFMRPKWEFWKFMKSLYN
jgi:hypothetical protein